MEQSFCLAVKSKSFEMSRTLDTLLYDLIIKYKKRTFLLGSYTVFI